MRGPGIRVLRFSPDPALEGAREADLDVNPMRDMTDDVLDGFSGSPIMGALERIGDPGGSPTSLRDVEVRDRVGELYMNVAASTIEDPSKNATVIG